MTIKGDWFTHDFYFRLLILNLECGFECQRSIKVSGEYKKGELIYVVIVVVDFK